MDELQQKTMNSSEDFHRNENGSQNSVIIIPALLSGSTLIVIAAILWKWIRRKKRDKAKEAKEKDCNLRNRSPGGCITTTREPSRITTPEDTQQNEENGDLHRDWAVNDAGVYENSLDTLDPIVEKKQLPSEWTVEHREVICNGHFGPISRAVLCYSGKTEDSQQVILKELSEHCSPGEVQDFMDLMKFYVQVCNHESLVKMLWCQTERRPPSIIMAAMSYGNLLSFLRNSRQVANVVYPRITERDVYLMSSQVASGLEYLSEMHDLVHGYVAACNVLIHEDLSVQLCGLGLAAIQYRSGSVPARRAAQVPLKWQSPERLKGSDITEKSDVWSFGILLYEIVTLGSPPYPDLDSSQLPSKLQKNYRMELPPQCGPRLFEVMSSCWQWEAPLRPHFTDVVKQLQNAAEQADGLTPVTAGDALSWSEYLRVAGIPS